MTDKIIEILKENETLTECKQYFLVKRKDYQKVANEIEAAINYTRCCEELKDKHKMSFNDWLRVNYNPTTNKNLFIKDGRRFLRDELIEVYEEEQSL